MKVRLLFIILVILTSCQQKKQPVPVAEKTSLSEEKIKECYQESISWKTDTLSNFCDSIQNLENSAGAKSTEAQAMVYLIKGLHNSSKSQYRLGLKHYEKAFSLLQKSNADSLKAKALNGMGHNYKIFGEHKKAVEKVYAALRLYEKNKDSLGIGSALTLLGDIYFQLDQMPKAKEAYEKAMDVLKNHKPSIIYLSSAHSLANYYGMKGAFLQALQLDEMGIKICDSLNLPKMKVAFLDNKANCFLFSNQMDSAYYYFKECLKLDLINGNKKQIADSYSNMGQFFLMKKDLNEAEKQIKKSIEILKEGNLRSNLSKALSILAEIYAQKKEFQKANAVNKELVANNKFILQEREASALAEYKIVYETEKKEARIKVLELENKVRNLQIKQQQSQAKRSHYILILLGICFLSVLVIAYFWYHHVKLKSSLEKKLIIQETEEHERIRMAKDIHDDLGSDLSKINFLCEILSKQTQQTPDLKKHTSLIQETAQKMIDNMRNLIWAMNPKNATLNNLVSRMREHTTDYLEDYKINATYDITENIPQKVITSEAHRTLFLVIKEAINNIAKHADAKNVHIVIQLSEEKLKIVIQDDGKGFETVTNGNGLQNMKSRIEDLGGTFVLESNLFKGTSITFEMKCKTVFND
ncbi:histidine kinase [Flavobacterium sp.]|uniref:tetratricopeptide repeat-containing sensor histidine kinase n=1 Tax=Flavobacterium sp. TaxID=239 RepID=UPI00260531EE|nr:histidine kinase [Flavobacterium sp.]MDD3005165.1 tetratricopeptide repeat protein [Flavobacterium sp.]